MTYWVVKVSAADYRHPSTPQPPPPPSVSSTAGRHGKPSERILPVMLVSGVIQDNGTRQHTLHLVTTYHLDHPKIANRSSRNGPDSSVQSSSNQQTNVIAENAASSSKESHYFKLLDTLFNEETDADEYYEDEDDEEPVLITEELNGTHTALLQSNVSRAAALPIRNSPSKSHSSSRSPPSKQPLERREKTLRFPVPHNRSRYNPAVRNRNGCICKPSGNKTRKCCFEYSREFMKVDASHAKMI